MNRKAIHALLVSTKQYLARDISDLCDLNKDEYICWAMELVPGAVNDAGFRSRDCIDAQTMIQARIEPHTSFGGWLCAKLGKRNADGRALTDSWTMRPAALTNRLQAHRHAWLDMLIKEFSK